MMFAQCGPVSTSQVLTGSIERGMNLNEFTECEKHNNVVQKPHVTILQKVPALLRNTPV